MRILLTGSSGWLGRFLAPRLRAAGHVAIGLDVAPGANTQVVGSVADRAVVERAFTDYGIEAVVHAAALHKPDIARYQVSAFIDVNVTGTLNLLEAAVAASHDRFVFTSTTSLMISDSIHRGEVRAAVWLDENFGPLAPRNIYGITKLAAEGLCRLHFLEHGLNCVILRAGRFFPEEDDTRRELPGPNLKANEFLNRRLTVEDSADAHVMALDRAPALGFEIFILSAPTPFDRSEAEELQRSAADVIARHFPDSPMLYARRGWQLPRRIGRVYDASRIERLTGFRCATDFGRVLDALRTDRKLPFIDEPGYQSPKKKPGSNIQRAEARMGQSRKPTVFGAPYSVYVRSVRLTLEEKAVDYDLVPVDIFAAGGRPREQVARHPFGKIPAFEHDSFRLYEAGAIARYIDEAFAGVPLQPADVRGRARMTQIISILDSYAYRTLVWDIYVERVARPAAGSASDEQKIAAALPKATVCLSALAELMGNRPWLTGSAISLADLHAAPMFAVFGLAPEGERLLNRERRLADWWDRMSNRPSFARTQVPPRHASGLPQNVPR